LVECVDCGRNVSEADVLYCSKCDRAVCMDCVVYCSDCGAPLCNDCGSSGLCPSCEEAMEAEEELEILGTEEIEEEEYY